MLTTFGFPRPLRVIHSALCTRVLLNLRHASSRTAEGINTDEVSRRTATLVFHHSLTDPHDEDASSHEMD